MNKCSFMVVSVNLLSFVVTKDAMRDDYAKVSTFVDWHMPIALAGI